MKKVLKPLISVMAIGALSISINFDSKDVLANDNDITKKCEYNPVLKINPDFSTMNCLLTETALKYDVPPEIVKAIAEGESGNWRHFDENGKAIVTADNGIGIMQITNQAGYDKDRLKSDVVYNIQAGVEILNNMFERKDLPIINDGDQDRYVLEKWYFAVMAYNGTKPVNSPIVQATGERNTKAYQEKIFGIIEKFGLIDLAELKFTSKDFTYDSNSRENIKFTNMKFDFDSLTKSKHYFEINQKVSATTTAVRVRTKPTSNSNNMMNLEKGEIVTITGPFEYDADPTKPNHFVWYPVKTSDGMEGYVASSYLTLTPTMTFKDVPANHYAKHAIDYLAKKNILNGWVKQDKFGLGEDLTRLQALLLINSATDVSTENRPDPGLTDIPKDSPYYKEIAAAVDEGFFEGTPDKKFEPNKILKRSEMAEVFHRIYDFPSPTSAHPFIDVKNEWFADSVARMYAAGITGGVTANQFSPNAKIKKEDFVLFLVRSMDETYRLK